MSIDAFRCDSCARVCHPARRLCPGCGGGAWTALPITTAVVEECTTLPARGGLVMASLRAECGVVVIAALAQPAAPGTRLLLRQGARSSVHADSLGSTSDSG